MKSNRREFISTALTGSIAATTVPFSLFDNSKDKNFHCAEDENTNYAKLDEVLQKPVFKKELFTSPVIIESVELLRHGRNYMCRVRSKDGAEGISVAHHLMYNFYPLFINNLQQMFIGLDARRLDEIIEKALIYGFNYRYKPLPIGVPLATIEFAILDMMGRIANKPVGQLIGDIYNTHIPVYQATEFRERSIEESLELIVAAVERYKAQALKIKVGA